MMEPLPREHAAFLELFDALRDAKPNDRSPRDRAFAVVLTLLEQAFAYYLIYCTTRDLGLPLHSYSDKDAE